MILEFCLFLIDVQGEIVNEFRDGQCETVETLDIVTVIVRREKVIRNE